MTGEPSPIDVQLDRWQRLVRYQWFSGWTALGSLGAAFVSYLAWHISSGIARYALGVEEIGARLLITVLLVAVLLGASTLVLRMIFREPQVNLSSGRIRAGRRSAAIAELNSATLEADAGKARALTLRFGTGNGLRAAVVVRNSRGAMLDERSRALVLETLRRSSIAMPVSKDDPTGRFSHVNFPGHVSKDEAISLIEDPPEPGKPLPFSLG